MKYLYSAALLVALCNFNAHGQQHGFGVGVLLGEPLGASFKAWLSDKTAIDGGVAYSFYDEDGWQIHSDYLWHNYDLLSGNGGHMPVYYGIGGRIKFAEDTEFGVRLPVGVSYMLDRAPVDLFAEVAPILGITPGFRFDFSVGVGARYWF